MEEEKEIVDLFDPEAISSKVDQEAKTLRIDFVAKRGRWTVAHRMILPGDMVKELFHHVANGVRELDIETIKPSGSDTLQ